MSKLAVSASVLCLFQLTQAEGACKGVARPIEQMKDVCDAELDPELSTVDPDARIQACVLARPVQKPEAAHALNSIRDSNCFLKAVLRPALTDAIRRGANAYLAMRRSDRGSTKAATLFESISRAIETTRRGPSDAPEDVLLLLQVFIERTYGFEGVVRRPVSRLEKSGRRKGIYDRYSLGGWVVHEYAAFLTENKSMVAETTERIAAINRQFAPPSGYSTKGCRRRILYTWPTFSLPFETYADLQAEPVGNVSAVHWGVCPDDHSLWVYSYLTDWKKAPEAEAIAACEQLKISLDDLGPVSLACEGHP